MTLALSSRPCSATTIDTHSLTARLNPPARTWGWSRCVPRFLHELRDITGKHGVVLIFDEVVTGFRIAKGGAQSLYDVTPDMTTLAKILGGGLPGGAVAGKADIINMMRRKQ